MNPFGAIHIYIFLRASGITYQGSLEKPDSPPSTVIDYLKLFIWGVKHWEIPSIHASMCSSVLIMHIFLSRNVLYFIGKVSVSYHERHCPPECIPALRLLAPFCSLFQRVPWAIGVKVVLSMCQLGLWTPRPLGLLFSTFWPVVYLYNTFISCKKIFLWWSVTAPLLCRYKGYSWELYWFWITEVVASPLGWVTTPVMGSYLGL